MHIVRVFDQLIYNTDRNLANLVITQDWNLKMIDHTRSFRINRKLKDSTGLVRCDRDLLERLRRLNEEDCMRELRPYLTRTAVRALLVRRDRIVDHFESAVAKRGELFVFYDFLPQATTDQ